LRATQKVTLALDEAREPITVRVEDERGYGVEFAQVTAMSISAEVQRKTTGFTDDRGEVELRGLRGLPIALEAIAPGYAPEHVTTQGADARVRIALSPSEHVEGEVRADRGGMVAGARVTLETLDGARTVVTNADGEYKVGDLHPGPVTIRVRADGFAEGQTRGTIRDERGRRATELPRVSLEQEATASGIVVDETGKPVAGARVAEGSVPVVLAGAKLPGRVVLTDRSGAFTLGQLPSGRLGLEAYAAGAGRGRIEGVVTERGREVRDIRIVLVRGEGDPAKATPGAYGVAVTLGESRGEVVVVQVAEGSQAEQAGLRTHDVIESVQGTRVTTIEQARARLDGASAEDVVVRLRSEVDGEERESTVRIRREPVRR
ncbi:MAG: PDZ domain-containing protein, partial [Proteobacteria bacterium]